MCPYFDFPTADDKRITSVGRCEAVWRCPGCWALPWLIKCKKKFSIVWHIEDKTKWPPSLRWHFKRFSLNENVRISIEISLKFVLKVQINNITELVQIMAWRRAGNKPLSELMMVRLPTHLCITRPQWVKSQSNSMKYLYMRGLVQDCSNSIANAVELLQSCAKPSILEWLISRTCKQ